MTILLIAVLTVSVIGIIACLAMRGPMIRAFEDRHGLTNARKAVTEARKARTEAKIKVAELARTRAFLDGKLTEIETESKKLDAQLKALPPMVYTLVFELGGSDPNVPAFDFILSRTRRSEPGDVKGPERELWARPRLLRCRSRNAQTAMAAAVARFPASDGFTVRVAERLDEAQGS